MFSDNTIPMVHQVYHSIVEIIKISFTDYKIPTVQYASEKLELAPSWVAQLKEYDS